jgi:hypothetical protein
MSVKASTMIAAHKKIDRSKSPFAGFIARPGVQPASYFMISCSLIVTRRIRSQDIWHSDRQRGVNRAVKPQFHGGPHYSISVLENVPAPDERILRNLARPLKLDARGGGNDGQVEANRSRCGESSDIAPLRRFAIPGSARIDAGRRSD